MDIWQIASLFGLVVSGLTLVSMVASIFVAAALMHRSLASISHTQERLLESIERLQQVQVEHTVSLKQITQDLREAHPRERHPHAGH